LFLSLRAGLRSNAGTLSHGSHKKKELGCAAPERSNLHLSPMPLSMSGDRFGWETRQPRDDRKAKSELHTTNSCHCERTWRVIPIRCLTGPMEKGAWDVLSLSEAIPTCSRCLYYVRRSPRPETHRPRDDKRAKEGLRATNSSHCERTWGSNSSTLPQSSHEKRNLGCAATKQSNPQLPPVR